MAILKCKMCGGDIEISADKTFGTCESCGSTMTFPKLDDEQRADAFNRGNHFRRIGEFDKALSVYERIVEEEPTNAEAHWCCALCRFGIEYVEDPASFEYVPTCHRASFDIFTEDVDFLAAVENADGITKKQYQKDGAKIAEVQRGILKTSQNEEPFDVFICYKESDDGGNRTVDSTLAQDIYYQLTDAGLRVFFARITLEDKVGSEYEPYIFAALNSAKAMVVVGTKPEYFNAVWVKNEWSRYLSIVKRDRSKVILPCYKDMDPYDLPEQLSVLQSYDMSKIGFIQDLIRGIKKIAQTDKPKPTETVVINNESAHIEPLLKRAEMSLEDGEWQKADEFCEQVLNQDPENATAYLYKLMAELNVRKKEELKNKENPFDNSPNYQKAVRFGEKSLINDIEFIKERNENDRLTNIYNIAKNTMNLAKTENAFKTAADKFATIPGFEDADELAEQCLEKAEICRKDAVYDKAKSEMTGESISRYETAITMFKNLFGWKDSDEQIILCQKKIEEIKAKEEADRLEAERRAEERRIAAEKAKKRQKRIIAITTPIVAACIAFVIVLNTVIIPKNKYNAAVKLYNDGKYDEAISTFSEVKGYKDSDNLIKECLKKADLSGIISAGYHTVGLKSDGTVVACGDNDDGQCDVGTWKDIVAVSAGSYHTVGLKSDGTVIACGNNRYRQCDVKTWKDIVAVSAGCFHTIGLKSDGTVVACGRNFNGQCNVEKWKDIVAVSADGYDTVGLKSDGTVVACGNNYYYGQCNVEKWKDIVAVSAGGYHTVGLKSDGTVVACGDNDYGQCDVGTWKDIVAVYAGDLHTVGLKSDGTVVACGRNDDGQRNVQGWKLW